MLTRNEVKTEFVGLPYFLDVDQFANLTWQLPIAILKVVTHLFHDFLPDVFNGVGGTLHSKHTEVGGQLF